MIIEQSEKLKKVLKDIIENKNFENEFNSLIKFRINVIGRVISH